jgi:ATP-dependent DNA helicase RecQ
MSSPALVRNYIYQKRTGYKILDLLVRNYTDILHLPVKVKSRILADKLNIKRQELLDTFTILHKREIIDYQPEGDQFSILFLLNRDENTFKYKSKSLKKRIAHKRMQVANVLKYVENNTICRAQFLAAYFEENNSDSCRICNVCQAENKALTPKEIYQQILLLLSNKCLSKKELQQEMRVDIAAVLDKLLSQNKIIFSDFKYCISKR